MDPQFRGTPLSATCPSPARLILLLVPDASRAPDPLIDRHVQHCASCQRQLAELGEAMHALRTHSFPSSKTDECLDELALAKLLDAGQDPDTGALRHLAGCAQCRAQLTAAARLLDDPLVTAEARRADTGTLRLTRRSGFAVAAGLAAAVAAVLFWPDATPQLREVGVDSAAYRERTLTTTAAPRILAPTGVAAPSDSLRWSSVPGADLYRITVWRHDGTVAWTGEVRDTVLPLPGDITGSGIRTLLWDVKARTGWDRWVVSDLVELTLQSATERTR